MWLLEDKLEAFPHRLLIVIPSSSGGRSSSSQLSLNSGEGGRHVRDFDIAKSLKMFGWHTDNAGHMLNRNRGVAWS